MLPNFQYKNYTLLRKMWIKIDFQVESGFLYIFELKITSQTTMVASIIRGIIIQPAGTPIATNIKVSSSIEWFIAMW